MQMRSNLPQTSGLCRYWTIKAKCWSTIMYSQTWLHSLIRKFHPANSTAHDFFWRHTAKLLIALAHSTGIFHSAKVLLWAISEIHYLRFAPIFTSTVQSNINCSTSSLSFFLFVGKGGVTPSELRWNWNIHKHKSGFERFCDRGFRASGKIVVIKLCLPVDYISHSFFLVSTKTHRTTPL